MRFPLKRKPRVPLGRDAGAFGAVRRYDTHTGVDLYANHGSSVFAMEDGIVVGHGPFTGPAAGSPWWLDTDALLVEGESGVILYGEIKSEWRPGMLVREGDKIAVVERVLREFKGKPVTMLHLELYSHGYRGGASPGETWTLDGSRPDMLQDPTPLLLAALDVKPSTTVCPRCRATLSSRGALSRHKLVCPRRKGEEHARNVIVQKLRERGAYLPPPVACPVCGKTPIVVTGDVLYPYRPDLHAKQFWRCPDGCAHVGCHSGTQVPLGDLAAPEVRVARMNAHNVFDDIWKIGGISRPDAYRMLAERMGISQDECHIGKFDKDMCDRAVSICRDWMNENKLTNPAK